MPKASGIPHDEVLVQRNEMGSGENPAAQSAHASDTPAPPSTQFIVHTQVEHTSDDVGIAYTYDHVRLSDWMIPAQAATVQLSTVPGSQCPARIWDRCLATLEGHTPSTPMAQLVTHAASSMLEAKQLASDKPGECVPKHPRHMSHVWDVRGSDRVVLI